MNTREKINELDSACCTLHNLGAGLVGNQQYDDIEWLAHSLFSWSRLGAGDIATVPWLLDKEEWNILGLTPESIWENGRRFWAACSKQEKDAWRKLARICLHVFPKFCERVGARYMDQAEALRQVWKEETKRGHEELMGKKKEGGEK